MLLGGLWHGASWTFVVWGALHGGGLAVTRFFQRVVADRPGRATPLLGGCALIAIAGVGVHWLWLTDSGVWPQLVAAWLYLVPLWAVVTAWLSHEAVAPQPPPRRAEPLIADDGLPWWALFRRSPEPLPRVPDGSLEAEILRVLMVALGIACGTMLLPSPRPLDWLVPELPSWSWLPLVGVLWALGLAADAVERGWERLWREFASYVLRAVAAILVFHYICLAWIFFRASSFDNALAVLRQLATLELDRANLVPLVTLALAVGFAGHLFADGSFRWLQERFKELPAIVQGVALVYVVLVLRELGHARLVPFIYFQF